MTSNSGSTPSGSGEPAPGQGGGPSPSQSGALVPVSGAAAQRDLTAVTLPPYHIIDACRTLGFFKPLDCFWSEITAASEHFLQEHVPCTCADYRRIGSRWSGLRASATITVYVHRCLFNDKDVTSIYRMGQCPACNTIYWTREGSA